MSTADVTVTHAVLFVHIALGMVGLVLGPVAMTARKRPGLHTRTGEAYHSVVLGVRGQLGNPDRYAGRGLAVGMDPTDAGRDADHLVGVAGDPVGEASQTLTFLGLGAGLPPGVRTALFTVAVGVVLCGLALLTVRRYREGSPTLGLALLVAGGASNWIDRVTRGGVVDFLNVGVGPVRTGVFNVADVAIILGAFVFVLSEYRGRSRCRDGKRPNPDARGDSPEPGA
jgi:hypothetical protein